MKKFFVTFMLPLVSIIGLDQLTKWLARTFWQETYEVTRFLAFELTFNRGISWGLLQSAESNYYVFMIVSFIIALLTGGLFVYTIKRYRAGYSIYGEMMILAGSLSNLIDRWIFGGVLDFIVLHWGDILWPTFNVADMFIVFGVGIMFMQQVVRTDEMAPS